MKNFLGGLLCVAGLIVAGVATAASPDQAGTRAFGRLSTLLGSWQGKFADGREHRVTYRLTAGGSVLVETWALGPGRESLTLYHVDGETLLADHYCPQGNQPRLQLAGGDGVDKFTFTFREGANLQVAGKSHQHSFWVRLRGPDAFERSETYIENGTLPQDAEASDDPPITYTRVVAE